jgi:chromosome partitioning protein
LGKFAQEIDMKVITAYSHKGGTGKTTALMMLASAIEARGQSALLVDCDPHQSFKAYQSYSAGADPAVWSDKLDVVFRHYEATSLTTLEETLLDADESGKYDFCLLNLAGVDHPFNRHVLRYAELTLVPFAPAALDMMELPGALNVVRELGESGEVGEVRVVFTKMKSSRSKMNAAQNAYIDSVIEGFPVLKTEIHDTAVLGDLVMRGLLGRAISAWEGQATGLQKMEVMRLRDALAECEALLAEAMEVIGEGE